MKAVSSEDRLYALNKRMRFIIASIVMTVSFSLLFGFYLRQVEKASFIEVGKTVTESSNQSVKLWLDQQRKLGQNILSFDDVKRWQASPQNQEIQQKLMRSLGILVGRFNQLENIQIILFKNSVKPWETNNSGTFKLDAYRTSAREQADQRIVEETGAAEAILEQKPYYLSAIYSDKQQKPVFDLTLPISKDNEVVGMLSITLRFSNLTDAIINKVQYKQSGYLFLIDDRGETIAHKNTSYVLSDADYLQDIVNKLLTHLNQGDNLFRGNFQGSNKLYYGVKTGLDKAYMRNQWYLAFTQKESEIYTISKRFWLGAGLFLVIQLLAMLRLLKVFSADRAVLIHQEIQLGSQEILQEEIRLKQNEVIRQTNLDAFTQLGHFQSVQRVLERLLLERSSSGKPFTLALFHLDQMGQFNETYGLAQGDIIIYHLGKLLRETFGDNDYVGRVYGDVFSIILPDSTLIEALVIVEQFKRKYAEAQLDLIQAKPTLSFGVAQWQGEDVSTLILKAESQLKKSKKAGINQVKY